MIRSYIEGFGDYKTRMYGGTTPAAGASNASVAPDVSDEEQELLKAHVGDFYGFAE